MGHERTGRWLRGWPSSRVAARLVAATLVSGTCAAAAQDNAAPPAVVVAPAVVENVSRGETFVGRIRAIQSVSLVSRVEGFLTSVEFEEGQTVSAGDVMFEIEKGPYEASLAVATAQHASAQAQLTGAQAQLQNQETILARQVELLQRNTVSQATVDDASSARDAAAARVGEAEAAVQQASAQIDTAQLNLGYATIMTPISGRVGALSITEGNLVSSQSGTLATIVQVDPIRVAFAIPEAMYVHFTREGAGGEGAEPAATGTTTGDTAAANQPQTSVSTSSAAPADGPGTAKPLSRDLFTPTLTLADGTVYDHPGTIAFASNEIDTSTGTLVIYADFPNPRASLLPGGFVRVRVDEARQTSVPVVPASAILQDRDGPYLFVVDAENRAQQRRVEVGAQIPDGVPVMSGLAGGELVIVVGVQRVRPGIVVAPTTAGSAAAANAASAPAPQPAAAQ